MDRMLSNLSYQHLLLGKNESGFLELEVNKAPSALNLSYDQSSSVEQLQITDSDRAANSGSCHNIPVTFEVRVLCSRYFKSFKRLQCPHDQSQ